jgi:transcriptional regulator with XRE-family HTH domain
MTQERKRRPVPYLKFVREGNRLSQSRLAEIAGVSRHTIMDLERNPEEAEARPKTVATLANALGVLPEDLTGAAAATPGAHRAYLDALLAEQKSYGPGDPLFDDDPALALTDLELAEFVRHDPKARRLVAARLRVRERIRRGMEQGSEEHEEGLEAERVKDAG